jgi:hypothetical protein
MVRVIIKEIIMIMAMVKRRKNTVIMMISINTKIMILKNGVMNMTSQNPNHLSPLVTFLHSNPLHPLAQKRDVMLVNIVLSIPPALLNALPHVITRV